MQETPVVISGSIAIDRIMHFTSRYQDYIDSRHLGSLSISIFLDELKDTYGGVGANIAYSLALLGDEPMLVGSVGPDASAYMERLAHSGVNITHVHESKLPTASFNVITDAERNQVGGFYPGAMFDSGKLTFSSWKNSNPIIVISPHDPDAMRRQVQECKEWGLRLCYDVGQQVANLSGDDMRAGIKAAEILILNEYEMTILSKKVGMSAEQIKSVVPIVVTTLGQRGAIIEGVRLQKPLLIGAVKAKRVADPTGAGDAFRAGFLFGYSRNWSLRICAQLGAVCATYAIESVGTQGHVFTYNQVVRRYNAVFGQLLLTSVNEE